MPPMPGRRRRGLEIGVSIWQKVSPCQASKTTRDTILGTVFDIDTAGEDAGRLPGITPANRLIGCWWPVPGLVTGHARN